jgi:hypothetical protein
LRDSAKCFASWVSIFLMPPIQHSDTTIVVA